MDVSVFDELLAQDCRERILRRKLPLSTRQLWSRYIDGPDSFEHSVGYQVLDSHLPSVYMEGSESMLTQEQIKNFKLQFKGTDGLDFNEVIEWMRDAPKVRRRREELVVDAKLSRVNALVRQFNKANFDLDLHSDNQDFRSARDGVAILLALAGYHRELFGFRSRLYRMDHPPGEFIRAW